MLRLQLQSRTSISYGPEQCLDISLVSCWAVPVPTLIFVVGFFPVGSVQSISSFKFHKTLKGRDNCFPCHSEQPP